MSIKKFGLAALALVLVFAAYSYIGAIGLFGVHQSPGTIHPQALPQAALDQVQQSRNDAAAGIGVSSSSQILFGDLHVHTTFSNDAYLASLPLAAGEGSHPPADACDYARYCSALDFWSSNDHAVSLNQQRWTEIKESIRQCNAVTDENNPDVVAFLGYEWTQADKANAGTHYGHKNIVFKYTDEARVAARPIYAETDLGPAAFNPAMLNRAILPMQKFSDRQSYYDWNLYIAEIEQQALCPKGISSKDLPADCKEGARTPADLFRKLDEAGHEAMVIPHGNTWGMYTPATTTWDKQLAGDMQSEKYQNLMEVFSGHGNSEEYRDWRDIEYDDNGKARCPAERPDYLPMCVQAGKIIQQRCLDAGESVDECQRRAIQARQHSVEATWEMATVPGTQANDWLDAMQCRDCFLPAFNYRPGGSSQYALAIGNFDNPDKIRRFRFGFIASSDNHTARPGTGFKEIDRRENVEAFVISDPEVRDFMLRNEPKAQPKSIPVTETVTSNQAVGISHVERASSFFLTGGLVAVHASERNREGIWDALQAKQTYATSGERILLWFDMLDPQNNSVVASMGSELSISHTPKFRVRAVGSFEQKPGCPDYSINSLGTQRLDRLCRNECYNPSDKRKIISRIEVIRIRPQMNPDENVAELIEDTWLSHNCPADPNGCSFEFEDPDFVSQGRETLYYVRAIQQPSLAVNAALMRCEYNEQGECIAANVCSGNVNFTNREDDCLAENEERAWSSPIFVEYR